jgi:hypothetical protein
MGLIGFRHGTEQIGQCGIFLGQQRKKPPQFRKIGVKRCRKWGCSIFVCARNKNTQTTGDNNMMNVLALQTLNSSLEDPDKGIASMLSIFC